VRAFAVSLIALGLLTAATGCGTSNQHPTQSELEAELVCPTCHEPLDESNSPVAQQMKLEISRGIAAGETTSQIVNSLVGPPNNLGPDIIGVPRTHGFDLLAWVLPFTGIAIGAAALAGGAWYWSHNRDPNDPSPPAESGLDPELERRVDAELAQFDA
jgi:cytochrome c-type biogenesis protein CcmH/NrfF